MAAEEFHERQERFQERRRRERRLHLAACARACAFHSLMQLVNVYPYFRECESIIRRIAQGDACPHHLGYEADRMFLDKWRARDYGRNLEPTLAHLANYHPNVLLAYLPVLASAPMFGPDDVELLRTVAHRRAEERSLCCVGSPVDWSE